METYKHDIKEQEGNVLFNDTLNTFYLWLYGIRHRVKDQGTHQEGVGCLLREAKILIDLAL